MLFCRYVLQQRFAIISLKPFKIRKHNDGKLSEMCGRIFHDVIGENPNVKMDKMRNGGGGGRSGVESSERIVESVRYSDVVRQNS
jgi:hypothetical protein